MRSRAGAIAFVGLALAFAVSAQEGAPAPQAPKSARTDRFGDPLPEEAVARFGSSRLRLDEALINGQLTFSADGKLLIWNGRTGLFAWDTATGRQLHRLRDVSRSTFLTAGSVSPDGKLFAVPGKSGVQLRDIATARTVRTIGTGMVNKVLFAPDGKTLAVRVNQKGGFKGGKGGKGKGGKGFKGKAEPIEFWDAGDGQKVGALKSPATPLPFHFTDDGKTFFTQTNSRAVQSWDVATFQQKIAIPLDTDAWRLAVSPGGKWLASIGYGDNGLTEFVRVWDVASGKERRPLTPAARKGVPERPVAFAELAFVDDNTLITAGLQDALIVWDVATGKERDRFEAELFNPIAIAVAPDRKAVAVASTAATVRLLDLESGKDRLAPLVPHPLAIQATVLTPDGRTAITAGGKTIRLWDPTTGEPRGRLDGHEGIVSAVRLLPDGHTLVSSASDNHLRFWDVRTAKERRHIAIDPKQADPARLLAVSPDGKFLAVEGVGGVLLILDAATGRTRYRLEGHSALICGAAFGPNGRTVVSWDVGDCVRVWDLDRREVRREFTPEPANHPQAPSFNGSQPDPVALSPDGRTLAYGVETGNVALFDPATGLPYRTVGRFPPFVSALAFSPDGRTLAVSGAGSPTIHLVEIATGGVRHRLSGANLSPTALTFSADGTQLLSGHADTTALVWELTCRLTAQNETEREPTPAELESLWGHLAGADSRRAYDAIRRLAAHPARAVPLLEKRIRPVPRADEARLANLIAALDAERFRVRNRAATELDRLGEASVLALRQALANNPSPEARRRMETLLRKQVRRRQSPTPDGLRSQRCLEILEAIHTPEADRLLQSLAAGAPGAQTTEEAAAALARRARFRQASR